jgi:ABC-type amino acid transport substrate-binding protein
VLWTSPSRSSQQVAAATTATTTIDFPTKITLRTGVLHAPPFANVKELDDGSFDYTGFQPDLLRQMIIFAQADNVELEILMSPAPLQYNDAFDRVANDCNTTTSPQNYLTYEQCTEFDLMAANYYATASRSMRAHLSAPILRSTISTIKYLNKAPGSMDFTTLSQAESAGATVCLKEGTFYAGLVQAKFPGANFLLCPSQDDCLAALKAEQCVLSADDELQIRFRVAWDETLDVTPEHFNTQYIVWALKDDLPPITLRLFEKWMYDANTNATNDALYSKYFSKALCPAGTAGESCELPCDPDHGAANSRGVCVCASTKWSGEDCSKEVPENVNLIPPALKLTAYVMLGINVATIIGCTIWLYLYRHTPQVKGSQPFFLILVNLGCLISSSTIVVLGQEDAGDGPVRACMAIPWLYSFGFSVTFGTLFAKIRRVYVIFTSSRDATRVRPGIISIQETVGVIGCVLAIDAAILMVWTIWDPLQWERDIIRTDQFDVPLESKGVCDSDYWIVFAGLIAILHLVLMGLACYLSYMARFIPTRFQEGKYVSIAMASNLQIFVVGVPILIIVGSGDPGTSFFVRSVMIWMNDLVVVALIFGNLIYHVHFDANRDNQRNITHQLGQSFKRYSRRSQVNGDSVNNIPDFSSSIGPGEGGEESNASRFGGEKYTIALNGGGGDSGDSGDSGGSGNESMFNRKKNSSVPSSSKKRPTPQRPGSTASSSRSNTRIATGGDWPSMPTISDENQDTECEHINGPTEEFQTEESHEDPSPSEEAEQAALEEAAAAEDLEGGSTTGNS